MTATILLTAILIAALLWLAHRLGYSSFFEERTIVIFRRRLALVFAFSWLGYGAVYFADMRSVSDAVQTGLTIALAVAAVFCAFLLTQPLAWGIDDYLAERHAQAEVQP